MLKNVSCHKNFISLYYQTVLMIHICNVDSKHLDQDHSLHHYTCSLVSLIVCSSFSCMFLLTHDILL